MTSSHVSWHESEANNENKKMIAIGQKKIHPHLCCRINNSSNRHFSSVAKQHRAYHYWKTPHKLIECWDVQIVSLSLLLRESLQWFYCQYQSFGQFSQSRVSLHCSQCSCNVPSKHLCTGLKQMHTANHTEEHKEVCMQTLFQSIHFLANLLCSWQQLFVLCWDIFPKLLTKPSHCFLKVSTHVHHDQADSIHYHYKCVCSSSFPENSLPFPTRFPIVMSWGSIQHCFTSEAKSGCNFFRNLVRAESSSTTLCSVSSAVISFFFIFLWNKPKRVSKNKKPHTQCTPDEKIPPGTERCHSCSAKYSKESSSYCQCPVQFVLRMIHIICKRLRLSTVKRSNFCVFVHVSIPTCCISQRVHIDWRKARTLFAAISGRICYNLVRIATKLFTFLCVEFCTWTFAKVLKRANISINI